MERLFYAVLGLNVLMVPLWLLLTAVNNAHRRSMKLLMMMRAEIENELGEDEVAEKAFGSRLDEASRALEEADFKGALRGRAARTEALFALHALASDLGLDRLPGQEEPDQ